MENAAFVLWNGLFVGMLFGTLGMMFGNCLGFRIVGIVLSALGVALAMMCSMFFGSMLMLHALDGAVIAKVYDGKQHLIIGLKLGPFTYNREIPEAVDAH